MCNETFAVIFRHFSSFHQRYSNHVDNYSNDRYNNRRSHIIEWVKVGVTAIFTTKTYCSSYLQKGKKIKDFFFHFLIFKKLTPSSTTSIHPVAWYSIDQHFLKYLFVSCPSPEKIRQSEDSVWKSQKSLIKPCERCEHRLHFEWTKVN